MVSDRNATRKAKSKHISTVTITNAVRLQATAQPHPRSCNSMNLHFSGRIQPVALLDKASSLIRLSLQPLFSFLIHIPYAICVCDMGSHL
jgi:hypothetical protein